jgi:hypothetical protein
METIESPLSTLALEEPTKVHIWVGHVRNKVVEANGVYICYTTRQLSTANLAAPAWPW